MLNEHLHFPVAVTISLMSPAKVSLLFPCRRDLPYLPPVDIPYYHLQSEGVSLSISLRHIDPGLISSGPFSMIEPTNSAPLSDDTTQWLNHMFFFSPSIRSKSTLLNYICTYLDTGQVRFGLCNIGGASMAEQQTGQILIARLCQDFPISSCQCFCLLKQCPLSTKNVLDLAALFSFCITKLCQVSNSCLQNQFELCPLNFSKHFKETRNNIFHCLGAGPF